MHQDYINEADIRIEFNKFIFNRAIAILNALDDLNVLSSEFIKDDQLKAKVTCYSRNSFWCCTVYDVEVTDEEFIADPKTKICKLRYRLQ